MSDFVRVCALDELPHPGVAAAVVAGRRIAIARVADGSVYAVDDECTHGAVALSEGELEGCQLECWLHGSRFDLLTGEPSGPPATTPVQTYPVRIEGDDVLVSTVPGAPTTASSTKEN